MPPVRGYEVRLRDLPPPERAAVNGQAAVFATSAERDRRALAGLPPARAEWWYEGETATIVVAVPPGPVTAATEIRVDVESDLGASAVSDAGARRPTWVGFGGLMRRLRDLLTVVNGAWPAVAPPEVLLNLVQVGNRLSIDPASARVEFDRLGAKLAGLKVAIDTLPLAPEARARATALFKEMGY
jgi:hypothetical protein